MSKKMVTPPKKYHRRLKEMVTPPSAWRNWDPMKDRGLGLGKLMTGALQVITHHDDPMYKMLEHMGRGGGSLRESFGHRWNKEHLDTVGEWEGFLSSEPHADFLAEYGDNPEELTNRELFNIMNAGDEDAMRSMLAVLGYSDPAGELSSYVGKNLWDLQAKYNKLYAEGMKPVEGAWNKFATQAENIKRANTMWGNPIDDDEVAEFAGDLNLKYGNVNKEVLSTVINEALNAIAGYNTEVS